MIRWTILRLILIVCTLAGVVFIVQDIEWLTLQKWSAGIGKVRVETEDDYADLDEDPRFETPDDEVDDGEDDPNLVAPRSHSGPYDEYIPGVRYILYHPSGGFSNQRMEIEYAVEIGKLLNRTVYVPMCGRHTNGWAAYNALKEGEDLFPMDRILDFPYIETYDHRVRLAPLNMTVSRFAGRFQKRYGPESVLIIQAPREFYGKEDVIRWRQYKQPLIFFRGPGFYHPWFPQSTMDEVRKHVRFTKYLRDLSIKVSKAALGEKFYAMHIRMGDYAYRRHGDASTYLGRARQYKWKLKEIPTYVATEPNRDDKFFAPLDRNMKIVYSDKLPKEIVKEFQNAFPKGKMRNDMLGLLEQLIAAQAKSFIGTFFSTFSAYIMFIREHKARLFPELVDVDTTGDGSAGDALEQAAPPPS